MLAHQIRHHARLDALLEAAELAARPGVDIDGTAAVGPSALVGGVLEHGDGSLEELLAGLTSVHSVVDPVGGITADRAELAVSWGR